MVISALMLVQAVTVLLGMSDIQGIATARDLPEAEAVGAAGLGAALVGLASLFANWAPTALSKKPPPEEALGDAAGLGAAVTGAAKCLLFANWAPTALSKKPPRGDASGLGGALVGVAKCLLFANWAPTALSKKPPDDLPATYPVQ